MPTETYEYRYEESSRPASGHTKGSLGVLTVCLLLGITFIFALFSSGLVLYSTKRFVGAIVALFAYLVTMHDVRMGLILVLFVIGLSTEMGVSGMEHVRLEDFLVPAIVLAWMCRAIRYSRDFEPTPLKLPILAYISIQCFSLPYGLVYYPNEWYWLPDFGPAAFTVVKTVQYYLLFFLVLNAMERRRDVKAMAIALVVAGTLSALLLGLGIGGITRTSNVHSRLSGPEGEGANILGGYFIIHIMVTILMAAHARRGWHKFLLGAAAIPQAWVLLQTLSRGSLVSVIAGLLAVGLLRQKLVLGMVLVFLIVVPVTLNDDMGERFATILDVVPGMSDRSPPSSWLAKVHAWQSLLVRSTTAPFLGRGAGRFPRSFVDSEYVKVIAETGALGFGVFVWMLYTIFRMTVQAHERERDPLLRGFLLGFLGGYIGLLVHAAAATSLTTVRTMEPLMFGVGMMAYLYNHPPARKPASRGAPDARAADAPGRPTTATSPRRRGPARPVPAEA